MSWAHYILQVNIYLLVFFGFYKLLLDKETYFTLNRFYLLTAGFLSLTIPFLKLEWFSSQPIAQPVYVTVGQVSDYVAQVTVLKSDTSLLTTGNLLALIYNLGVAFFVIRLVVRLISVSLLLKRDKSGLAFSFFGKKVIDSSLPGFLTINSHEEIHMRQLHSLDVIFFEVLATITWFNPVIYFYQHAVKNIHEYLADEEAARFQGNKEQYALLLLSSALGVTPSNLTNSFFNKSLIKKRIYMLHKQRSKKTAILKYGLFLPLFAVTLVMSSATIRNNEKLQELAENVPLDQPISAVKAAVEQSIMMPAAHKTSEPASNVVSAPSPSLPAENKATDWQKFYDHIKRTIRYSAQAQENKLTGKTQIKFTIQDGQIEGTTLAGPALGDGCDAEAMRAILGFPDFKSIPDGKYVLRVSYTMSDDGKQEYIVKNKDLPAVAGYEMLNEVVIRGYGRNPIEGQSTPLSEVNIQPNNGEKVYDFVTLETQPSFPGGMEKFYEYISKTVKYPKEAPDKNIQGKVFLTFVVETDGSLSNIKIDRTLSPQLDEEAVRILKASPKWIPGTQNGQNVRVKYNIPISFSLAKDENKAGRQNDPVYDFVSLEQQPAFKGGMKNFYTYLAKTVKYPAEAQRLNKQGKVFLSFIVEKDGSLSDIKVDRKAGYGLDEEAVRVLKASPNWDPGIQQGKKVRVKYNIPISFTLSK
ncbi:TonB family protein [Pedobacter sp. PWIIR3]